MTPVTQTKVVVKNSNGEMVVRGNCYAAVIASMLDLPITEVPNVEVLFDLKDTNDTYWVEVMLTFLNKRGLIILTDNDYRVFHDPEYKMVNERLDIIRRLKDRYYIVSGQSQRGVSHCCIYKNGNLVHDPHPTREGLLTTEYFEDIVPI